MADTKLNKVGMEQAELVGRRLRKVNFLHIYTSDLSRAKKTAEAIAQYHKDVPLTVDTRLGEKDFGRLSNLSIHAALNLIKTEDGLWEDYGESKETFSLRVISFFQEIIGKHLPPTNAIETPKKTTHICVVTHGGVINRFVKEYLIMELGFFVKDYKSIQHKPKNSSITKVTLTRIEEGEDEAKVGHGEELKIEGEVQLWSDVSHLSKFNKKTRGDTAIDDYVH
ncbi:7767_t:CDS:2 [Paraglomus brasilianum]|uniref:7767_t:CDS:1 n=1 Tax=Paraglomus brasilianum TaxID=144538 RepID=A0A9N9A4B8_9GLOM|nr:7767_t:CDS:2 [Paraglomus brasilianum]